MSHALIQCPKCQNSGALAADSDSLDCTYCDSAERRTELARWAALHCQHMTREQRDWAVAQHAALLLMEAEEVKKEPVAYRITFNDFRHFSGATASGRDYVQFNKPELDSRFFEGCDSLVITPLCAAHQPAAAPSGDAWVSVDERLPASGELVLVFIPEGENQNEDIRLDCIDPNDDDATSWYDHNEHYEHFCCVGKPPGTTGPSEKSPYTHWCPIPDTIAITATKGN